MEDISHLNVSWNVVKALLCNQTIMRTHQLNVTCEANASSADVSISPMVLRVVVCACVIFVIGTVFNVVLIITSSSNKRFRKSSWKYIMNLAVADILCMIAMALFAYYILVQPAHWSWYLFPSLDIFIASLSMLAVTAIALDRVNTVRSLERQISSLFHSKPNIVVASIWGYSLTIFTLALCRMYVDREHVYTKFVYWLATIVTFFGAVMVTFTCYIIITWYYVKYTFFSTKKQFVNTNSPPVMSTDGESAFVNINNNNNNKLLEVLEVEGMNIVREQKKKQKRVTKAFLTAITPLPFILGWSYFLGIQTYEFLSKTNISDPNHNIAMIIVPWLLSALNPILFILNTTSIRKQIKASLRQLLGLSSLKRKTPKSYDESIYLTEM